MTNKPTVAAWVRNANGMTKKENIYNISESRNFARGKCILFFFLSLEKVKECECKYLEVFYRHLLATVFPETHLERVESGWILHSGHVINKWRWIHVVSHDGAVCTVLHHISMVSGSILEMRILPVYVLLVSLQVSYRFSSFLPLSKNFTLPLCGYRSVHAALRWTGKPSRVCSYLTLSIPRKGSVTILSPDHDQTAYWWWMNELFLQYK